MSDHPLLQAALGEALRLVNLTQDRADAWAQELVAALGPKADAMESGLKQDTEWWYCVWCEVKYPYDDGPDTLKAHSAVCEKHPGNIAAAADRERILLYVEDNLAAWTDPRDEGDLMCRAYADIYRKIRNVIVTGHPLPDLEAPTDE